MLANLGSSVKRLLKRQTRMGGAGRTLARRLLYGRLAIVIVLAVLFLGGGRWPGRPVPEAEAFASKPLLQEHHSIVNAALGQEFADERLQIIRNAVNEADTGEFLEREEVHFDNSSFTAGREWIKSQYNVAVDKAGSCSTQEESLREWGLLLHTVQDFYSHSNFIEKGGRVPVGAEFLTLGNSSPGSLTAIVKGTEIKTGRYTGWTDFAFPSGNCGRAVPIFGYYLDEALIRDNTNQCNHWEMNKDTVTLDGPSGRPLHLFWAARAAAIEETRTQWQIFQQKIREKYENDMRHLT